MRKATCSEVALSGEWVNWDYLMIRVEVQDDPGQMISVRCDGSLVVQPVQQYINGLETISLDEKVGEP